ncbi:MAG TPA: PKD domain-containing protein [Candidatus Paceibacterota bacterium]|nr:PKD domain-containing protein [Candidatus Paceibacterota bacterium]
MDQKQKKISIISGVVLIAVVFLLSYILDFPKGFSRNLIGEVIGQKPVLSNLLVTNITQDSATVYWKTDIKSSTEILLGTSKLNLPQLITNDSPVSINGVVLHKIELGNLSPCTRYFFRVKSTSETSFYTNSAIKTIDTYGCGQSSGDIEPPAKVQNVRVLSMNSDSVTIGWDNSESSDVYGYAVFGPINNTNNGRFYYGKTKNINTFVIKNLTPGVSYGGDYGTNGYDSGFMVQAFDSSDNYSEPSDRVSFVFGSDCQSLSDEGENFSSKLNPTGNPIGGGECYTNIVNKDNADFIVSSKQALKEALFNAVSGQIIYVEDNAVIDLTGEKNLVIPGGVTLASGRGLNGSNGALLFSNSFFPEQEFSALFITGGDNIRITGLRLRGPNPDILDHGYPATGVANAIRSLNYGLEVDNNEIFAWDKWAVWLYRLNGAHVHHNFFHENIREGYGYSVWVGGAGNEVNASALIEANIFRGCRHCVASSGHENSWEARYNILLKRQLFINFDRHNNSSLENELGGKNTTLFRNLFLTTQLHFGFANPLNQNGFVSIRENWFKREDLCSSGVIGKVPACQNLNTQNAIFEGNNFGGQGVVLPTAYITTSVEEGVVPLAVNFSGNATSSLGNRINRYEWSFGNGDAYGDTKVGKNVTYTFTQPGIYKVPLVAYDAYGIPSETTWKTITVKPNDNSYILSAWVKDSYPGVLTDRYKKQFLINGNVIWEDDVSGNEGWQHIVLDVSNYLNTGVQAEFSMRLYSKNGVPVNTTSDIVELTAWFDDVFIFNTSMSNPDFETSVAPWKQTFYSPPGKSTPVGSGATTADARSGDLSWRFEFGHRKVIPPGVYAELYQVFTPN